jgi:hypothetical protein
MIRAHVASTATTSVPIPMNPTCRGRPMIGPSPSIAVTASTMEKWGRMVALRSRMEFSIPFTCRMFLGQP